MWFSRKSPKKESSRTAGWCRKGNPILSHQLSWSIMRYFQQKVRNNPRMEKKWKRNKTMMQTSEGGVVMGASFLWHQHSRWHRLSAWQIWCKHPRVRWKWVRLFFWLQLSAWQIDNMLILHRWFLHGKWVPLFRDANLQGKWWVLINHWEEW